MTASDYLYLPSVSVPERTTGPTHLIDNDMLPWTHFISAASFPDAYVGTIQGARVYQQSWWFSLLSWTGGTPAEFGFDFYVAAGTWRMEWLRDKRNDYPITQYKIDGVNAGGTFDNYAATRVRTVNRIDGNVIARGWHRFSMVVAGKNAASTTAYTHVFSGLILTRTA